MGFCRACSSTIDVPFSLHHDQSPECRLGTFPVRPTPYYEEAGITIYHGDCREILPFIGLVDTCFTSPPYNTLGSRIPATPTGIWAKSGGMAGFVRDVNSEGYADDLDEGCYQADQVSVVPHCWSGEKPALTDSVSAGQAPDTRSGPVFRDVNSDLSAPSARAGQDSVPFCRLPAQGPRWQICRISRVYASSRCQEEMPMAARVVQIRGKWYVRVNFHRRRKLKLFKSREAAEVFSARLQARLDRADRGTIAVSRVAQAVLAPDVLTYYPSVNRLSDESVPVCLQSLASRLKLYSSDSFPAFVYFLCLDDEVVYVGMTGDLQKRIATHRRDGWIRFDRTLFLTVKHEEAARVEAAFVAVLRPPHNGKSRGIRPSAAKEIVARYSREAWA